MQLFYLYLISIPIFVVGDLVWLWITRRLYRSYIGHLLGPVNWPATVAFYIVFLAGLSFFAINPGFTSGSIIFVAILGGMYGLFTYATYDLTNYATLKDWPFAITAIDIVWGTALASVVSVLTFLAAGAIL